MTLRQLITRALRLIGVVGSGRPVPAAYDAATALEAFKHLLTQAIGNGVFYPLTDVVIEADYTAGENERIVNRENVAITLPLTIDTADPVTGETTERTPYDRSVVLAVGAATYLYDADQAGWIAIENLTLDSVAPLGVRYGTALAALLAMEIAPEYGVEPSPSLVAMANDGAQSLYVKRPMTVSIDVGLQSRRWMRR